MRAHAIPNSFQKHIQREILPHSCLSLRVRTECKEQPTSAQYPGYPTGGKTKRDYSLFYL